MLSQKVKIDRTIIVGVILAEYLIKLKAFIVLIGIAPVKEKSREFSLIRVTSA